MVQSKDDLERPLGYGARSMLAGSLEGGINDSVYENRLHEMAE
jgi:hypothetical protein